MVLGRLPPSLATQLLLRLVVSLESPMPDKTPVFRTMPSRALLLEMIRFGLMGATSAGIYLVFFVPLRWVIPSRLWLASGVAYLLSMVVNYLLQRNYTFRSDRPHQEAVVRYLVVQFVGLGLNSLVLEVAHHHLRFPLWPSQGFAIICVAIWSYLAQKVWVFVGKRRAAAHSTQNV